VPVERAVFDQVHGAIERGLPPRVGSRASASPGDDFFDDFRVIGSMYVREANSGSVMIVAGSS